MNTVRPRRIIAGLLLSASATGLSAQGCHRLEAGTGDHPEVPHAVAYAASSARSLRVDLERDVAMIAQLDNRNFDPEYAVSLKPTRSGDWLLAYAVNEGIVRPTPASRASARLPEPLARRVANAWQHSIAEANADHSSSCIGLDGKSYVFSAGGLQAHVWEPQEGIPARLLEVSETLKDIALDAKSRGHSRDSLVATLDRQLAALESTLGLVAHSLDRNGL